MPPFSKGLGEAATCGKLCVCTEALGQGQGGRAQKPCVVLTMLIKEAEERRLNVVFVSISALSVAMLSPQANLDPLGNRYRRPIA